MISFKTNSMRMIVSCPKCVKYSKTVLVKKFFKTKSEYFYYFVALNKKTKPFILENIFFFLITGNQKTTIYAGEQINVEHYIARDWQAILGGSAK